VLLTPPSQYFSWLVQVRQGLTKLGAKKRVARASENKNFLKTKEFFLDLEKAIPYRFRNSASLTLHSQLVSVSYICCYYPSYSVPVSTVSERPLAVISFRILVHESDTCM
jgi:hypothetical protein